MWCKLIKILFLATVCAYFANVLFVSSTCGCCFHIRCFHVIYSHWISFRLQLVIILHSNSVSAQQLRYDRASSGRKYLLYIVYYLPVECFHLSMFLCSFWYSFYMCGLLSIFASSSWLIMNRDLFMPRRKTYQKDVSAWEIRVKAFTSPMFLVKTIGWVWNIL